MDTITYFKLKFTLLSPLSIGASNSEKTDRDIVLDSRKKPVIPATAIAGACRALCPESDRTELFGDIAKNNSGIDKSSELMFYDAEFSFGRYNSIVRDGVKLGNNKYAEKGKKFDFEVVETGAVFIGFVEVRNKSATDKFLNLLQNELSFGAKGTRGYGQVKLEYQIKEFKGNQLDEWLAFDMFTWKGNDWKSVDGKASESENKITLSLRQVGGLSVRQYYTEPNSADSGQLTLHDADRTPVIPGTSWAGMFKSHMKTLPGFSLDEDVFGYVEEGKRGPGSSAKSKIRFSESQIEGSMPKALTRNAIDRFTNGTKNGALFTEITVYGGRTKLVISFDNNLSDNTKSALYATILDLHNGYAAVGGLTSIGRGIFEIEAVNGNKGWNEKMLKDVIFYDK